MSAELPLSTKTQCVL